jgi:hypothetical protein
MVINRERKGRGGGVKIGINHKYGREKTMIH